MHEVPKINFFGEQMQSHTPKLGFQTNDVLFRKNVHRFPMYINILHLGFHFSTLSFLSNVVFPSHCLV